jgi:peroxiredoxin
VCNREAPGLEQFAREHKDTVRVVGLGTQDTFGEAQDFLARHGITFELLWDPTFESWRALGVSSQPTAMLLGPDGVLLGTWRGRLPESEILDLARAG